MDFFNLLGEDQEVLDSCIHPKDRESSDEELIYVYQRREMKGRREDYEYLPLVWEGNQIFDIDPDRTFLETKRWDSLENASRDGNLTMVQILVKNGAKNLTGGLVEACWHGHLDIVRFLVESGAFVNYVDATGFTPMMEAEYRGHSEIVEYMQSQGGTRTSPSQQMIFFTQFDK